MIEDGNLPAFPTDNAAQVGPNRYHYEGISVRDYFAAKALSTAAGYGNLEDWSPKTFAQHAYAIADAMLKERAK
jgi:hypothetical protein